MLIRPFFIMAHAGDGWSKGWLPKPCQWVLYSLFWALALAGCRPATVDTTNYPAPNRAANRLNGQAITHDTLFYYEDILWSFTWLPDGSVLTTDKSGKLLHVQAGKATEIAGVPPVWDQGQGGLLDVSLHPDYASNGWLYLTYSAPNPQGKGANTALMRAKLKGQQLVEQQKLYQATPYTERGQHFGSRIIWKDGQLYFSIGERGEEFVNPQDTSRDGGKIYRLNADGSIPADNPFPKGSRPAIYSYGQRNPQGLALHPSTNEIWEHEHGPRGGDEINIIQPGRNYGWPVITYGINYNGTKITDEEARQGMEQPLHYWVPSIAPSGMAFLNSEVYPGWKGDLFVGSLKFMYVKHLMLSADKQSIVGEEVLLKNLGRVRDVRQGPDGYLYASVEGTGLLRLLP